MCTLSNSPELTLYDLLLTAAIEVAANHALATRTVRNEDRRKLQRAVHVGLEDMCQLLHREQDVRQEFERAQALALDQLQEEDSQRPERTSVYLDSCADSPRMIPNG